MSVLRATKRRGTFIEMSNRERERTLAVVAGATVGATTFFIAAAMTTLSVLK